MVIRELKAAAKRALLSTNALSLATGISRSTFHYWFKPAAIGGHNPRAYREVRLWALVNAINAAVEAGELPADTSREAAKIIKKRMPKK